MVLEVWDWHSAYVVTTLVTVRPCGVGVYTAWLKLKLHLVLLLNSVGPRGEQSSLCSDPERHSESWSLCPVDSEPSSSFLPSELLAGS